jgi:hypothetical protein
MKKWFGIGLLMVGLYYTYVLIVAELSEIHAENRMEVILKDISSPWQSDKIRFYGSEWLNNRARLTPEKIASLAANDLGYLLDILQGPDCVFQSGYERARPNEELIWAMCDVKAHFEKDIVKLKIKLVDEPKTQPSLFGLLGQNLRLNDITDIQIIKDGEH